MGLVSQVFGAEELDRLKGTRAVGHARYSTTGSSTLKNAQPFVVDCFRGQIAVAHNGNLINAAFCATSWNAKAPFSKLPPTAKSSRTCSPSPRRTAAAP
jgi:Glutamine phosphoribosylpyrophosphate amidotransferase